MLRSLSIKLSFQAVSLISLVVFKIPVSLMLSCFSTVCQMCIFFFLSCFHSDDSFLHLWKTLVFSHVELASPSSSLFSSSKLENMFSLLTISSRFLHCTSIFSYFYLFTSLCFILDDSFHVSNSLVFGALLFISKLI